MVQAATITRPPDRRSQCACARVRRVDFGTAIEEIDVSDEVERFDVGIAMGGGVELGRLVIDGRYTLGMRDIDVDKTDGVAMKHRVISITAGLRF